MNNLDKQYTDLLQDILDNGTRKMDRTGTGTISVFGRQIRHKMSEGFPLLTTKKLHFKSIVFELLWFLRGDTNIKFLVDNGCHIWDGDAHKNYQLLMIGNEPEKILSMTDFIDKIKNDEKFAKHWGDLGPIYGKQWRRWETDDLDTPRYEHWKKDIDQIQNLINDLKTNPDSRRLMVNAWNVGELDQMVLPPCHYGFQVYTRELTWEERYEIHRKYITDDKLDLVFEFATNENLDKLGVPTRAISLMWNQRSVDTFLGLPFNIASYGLLLEIIAKAVNMVPDELIGNLGDVHLYSNHIDQAKEQIGRKMMINERMDWWFKNNKPNRDVCDHVDEQSEYGKGVYFDSVGVPKTTREPFKLPKLVIDLFDETNHYIGDMDDISEYNIEQFKLENYQSHPAIKAPLSN